MSQDKKTIRSTYSTWKGRGSLQAIVDEIKKQAEAKVDFVADTREVGVGFFQTGETKDGPQGHLRLVPKSVQVSEFIPDDGVEISPQALTQLAEKHTPDKSSGAKFFQRLAAVNPLRAGEFLTALLRDAGKRRLFRAFVWPNIEDVNDQHVATKSDRRLAHCLRGCMSDQYRMIDHYDATLVALERAQDAGAELIEGTLTDTKLRLKFVSRSVWDVVDRHRTDAKWNYAGGLGNQEWLGRVAAHTEGALPGGEGTVWPCTTLGNSETGHGGLRLDAGILAGICWNLAIVEEVVAQVHLGSRLDSGLFTRETMTKADELMVLKIRDGFAGTFNADRFKALITRVKGTQDQKIYAPTTAVDNLIAATDITEEKRDSILQHFLQEYDPTVYGLAGAVARVSQDVDDGDGADSLERIAGQMMVGKYSGEIMAPAIA